MNFSFLPSKIKEEIKKLVADKVPLSLARSSTSVDGDSGESYVIGYDDKLVVFSRKLGQNDYITLIGDLGNDVGLVKVRKEGVNTFLDTKIQDKEFSLKFSSFEEKSLLPISEQWQKVSSGGGAASAAPAETPAQKPVSTPKNETLQPASSAGKEIVAGELNYYTGLAVALMFVSAVDDEVSPEEDQYIRHCFNNDKEELQAAVKFYKNNSYEEFLVAVSGMNQDQKLCYLANMMELGMCDGVLHSSEMKIIRKFCDYMDLTDDEYATIKQVLLIKNQVSIL